MTKLIKGTLQTVFDGVHQLKMHPNVNYQKYVPQSAKQLAEDNWNRVGCSLKNAMNKVVKDNEPKI